MRALVYGQIIIDNQIIAMLQKEGIETQIIEEDFNTLTNLSLDEEYDLAIVDSRLADANRACRYIRENWDLPLILIVDSSQADWRGLKPIEADGYIPDVNKDGELNARGQALLRRLILRNKPE